MGLKIAQKIKQGNGFTDFPTHSDTIPTLPAANKSAFPTNRHIRQPERAANDDLANDLVTHDGMPVHFYDGGSNGWRFGDREWIAGKLRRIQSKAERLRLAAEYAERFKAVYDTEPLEQRKEGKARFSANSWLLKATK
ncbi:hypothetical protein CWE12_10675 [Aliidiomarina sedimenti]|uniref:Uncharacterized protein n=1 Tax=Aliidiomarina sedimenti TaxID=1933879 RepID=A0ABY0BWJ0_9GAMM|nr:hypothetical protein [Aliidiomarina sedimenti]RUO28770.1 hypothetical protein CWE12_10675 [Aliidiomarina sedimenti]